MLPRVAPTVESRDARLRAPVLGAAKRELVPWLLFLAAATAYLIIASGRVGPFIDNDEYRYGNLAQSIAAGDGFTWRGVTQFVPTLYPAVIAPAWMVSTGGTAYTLAKTINVLLICLAIIPTWLLARELAGERCALLACVALAVGAWMEMSGKLMAEALAFPAATAALSSMIVALRRPGTRWLVITLAASAVATAARVQLASLVLIFAVSLVLDCLRGSHGSWLFRLQRRRNEILVTWALVAVAAALLLSPLASHLGDYSGYGALGSSLKTSLRWGYEHGQDYILMVGVIPWILFAATAARPANWRDPESGPLLTVLTVSLLVFLPEVGYFVATVSPRVIERYVIYLAPLTLIAGAMGLTRARPAAAVAITVVTGVSMLTIRTPCRSCSEVSSFQTVDDRLAHLGPAVSLPTAAMLSVFAMGAITAVLLSTRDLRRLRVGRGPMARGRLAALLALAAMAAWLLNASERQWEFGNRFASRVQREALIAGHRDWVDTAVGGQKTIIVTGGAAPLTLWTEFFNPEITRVLDLEGSPAGPEFGTGNASLTCQFTLARPDGYFTKDRVCSPPTQSYVVLSGKPLVVTLRKESLRVVGPRPSQQQLLTGQPAFRAIRTPLCDPVALTCTKSMIRTWPRNRATVRMIFAGGTDRHQVAVDDRIYAIPPIKSTVIDVAVSKETPAFALTADWPSTDSSTPRLVRTSMIENGRSAAI